MSEPDPDPLPEDIIIRLLEGLDTSGYAPPPGLRQKVMQRMSAASDAGITTVRAQDGEWRIAVPAST